MKKIIAFLLIGLLCAFNAFPVFADDSADIEIKTITTSTGTDLKSNAELLSSDDENLKKTYDALSENDSVVGDRVYGISCITYKDADAVKDYPITYVFTNSKAEYIEKIVVSAQDDGENWKTVGFSVSGTTVTLESSEEFGYIAFLYSNDVIEADGTETASEAAEATTEEVTEAAAESEETEAAATEAAESDDAAATTESETVAAEGDDDGLLVIASNEEESGEPLIASEETEAETGVPENPATHNMNILWFVIIGVLAIGGIINVAFMMRKSRK